MSKLKITDFEGKIINLHTHTWRCQHAKKCDDREYVEKAIEAGYEVLGFSDHAPYVLQEGYVSPIRMRWDELDGYVDSVLSLKKEYAKDIDIYLGFEIEYFPKYFDKTVDRLDQYPVDYMILGQHYYDDEIGKISPKNGWSDEEHLKLYYDRVMAAIETDRLLYVAHPDIMNFTGDEVVYRKYMIPFVREMKRRGMPIEINLNGYFAGFEYPNSKFMELAVNEDCEFIVGIDAHSPKSFSNFEDYRACVEMVSSRGGRVLNTLPETLWKNIER